VMDTGIHPPEGGTHELAAQILAERWFHHINLNGTVTPGTSNKAAQDWTTAHLPARFDGLSVLDVGAWDGFFSFLAEERGAARVLAVDKMLNPVAHGRGTSPFELAKRIRGSHVEYRIAAIENLSDLGERFDVVLFLGVYYHMKDPLAGLKVIHELVKPGGRVYTEGLVVPGARPLLRFFGPKEVEPWTFWAPTISGLIALCQLAGFSETQLVGEKWGMGRLALPLRKMFPRYWTGGAVGTNSNLAHRSITRLVPKWTFWPRALVCSRP